LLLPACLNIQETPRRTDAGFATGGVAAGGAGGSTAGGHGGVGAGGYAGALTVSPCMQGCLDETGGDPTKFLNILGCTAQKKAHGCADKCTKLGQVPAKVTCSIPAGAMDDDPACGACLKNACCSTIVACVTEPLCISHASCSLTRCPF